ncbi:MAG: YbaB/EbfC family nucleoid-associated protein [Christensenella sp.]|nr:YbaB/EbfC family nucleoid-associated protein [Christensenella sp.]
MGNFGSFNRGGGMGNMQQLMKQAQKMQQDMLKAQEELKELEVTGSASNMVEVTLTCDGKMTGISIKPEAVDPDDIEMLEDLIVAAFNDATEKAEEVKSEKMGQFGGLGGLM